MNILAQLAVALIGGGLLVNALDWAGLHYWVVSLPACILLGLAVAKFWPWGRDGDDLRRSQEAAVLGAMYMGCQTVIGIWHTSGRSLWAVYGALHRLEERGVVVSLWDSEDNDGGEQPRRRLYYLTKGTPVGWDR